MAGGQAEPPITVRRMCVNFSWFCLTWLSSISHTVGTPAAMVTRSPSSSSYTDLPSSAAPGITSLAPVMAALYGMPQELTWNIGTTGRMVSRTEMFSASGSAPA